MKRAILLFFLFFSPVCAQKYADILMDAYTGDILHSVDADAQRYPASLTKMLTLYVIFAQLKAKRIRMDTQFTVPASAPIVEPCKLGLRTGQRISVRHIILGMITKSANDASVTAAVGISGSIAGFAHLMNTTAKRLGMHRSRFYNPHGLPDPRQVSTARDMALLSRALIRDFPEYYKLFKTRIFTYMGRCHSNHNHLIGHVEGLDGIKTGWFRRAGSNLAASAERTVNGKRRRFIAVVLGGENRFSRDKRIKQLLESGFSSSSKGKPTLQHTVYHKENLPSANLPQGEDPIGDLIHSKQSTHPKKITTSPLKQSIHPAKPLGTAKPLPQYVWVKGEAPAPKVGATATSSPPKKRVRKIIRRIKRINRRVA